MRVSLPYGHRPLVATVPDDAEVIGLPPAVAGADPVAVCRDALNRPIGARPLEEEAAAVRRVTLIVSDSTRADPRGALCEAALERLPADCAVTLAIATGTHGPCDVESLGLPAGVRARIDRVINHDGHAAAEAVTLGTTSRGTPVRVSRAALETGLLVLTGRILPHYFAGFGAGVKALYPGLGESVSVRVNHQLKREPGARAGVVDDNPCRGDMEEVLEMLPCPAYLLNVISGPGGGVVGAVAGDVRTAFREGADVARRTWQARGHAADAVVVSDRLPVTASLYQASKLVAAVAPLLRVGGTVVVAAECARGIGPVDVVNRGIYEIGLRPRLPADHRIALVSSLSPGEVAATYCEPCASVEAALAAAGPARVTVVPEAASLIFSSDHQTPVNERE